MIDRFVKEFYNKRQLLLDKFGEDHPENYEAIFETLIEVLFGDKSDDGCYDEWPYNFQVLNYGDNLLFIATSRNIKPNRYWVCSVDYGTCTVCDSFKSVRCKTLSTSYEPTEEQANGYLTMALHMLQNLVEIKKESLL